ncbi:MAG TPA: hypothetical protein VMU52_05930, partial [Steroidobacteraceae bacterium]|nr:hypothetical protein [Steroidobacteraceae bacterium]
TALERILELDSGWMSWDEARAIASEAHGLAVTASGAFQAEPQPAPELAAKPMPRVDWARVSEAVADREHERDEARDQLAALRHNLAALAGKRRCREVKP